MNHQTITTNLHPSEDRRRRRENKAENRLLLISLFSITLLFGGLWWSHLNEVPNYVIPSPTLPSPNAFDTYNQATALLAPQPKVAVDRVVDTEEVTDPQQRALRYSLKRKGAWLAQNAPALKLWHQGVKQPYMAPPLRSSSSLLSYLARYREWARYVTIESKTRALSGDKNGAANSALDIVQFSCQVPYGGTLFAAHASAAMQKMGLKQL